MVAGVFLNFSVFLYFTFFDSKNLVDTLETKFFRKILSYCIGGLILVSISTTYTAVAHESTFVEVFNLWSDILDKQRQFWK